MRIKYAVVGQSLPVKATIRDDNGKKQDITGATNAVIRYFPPGGGPVDIQAEIDIEGRVSGVLSGTVLSTAGEYSIMAIAMVGTEEIKSFGFILRVEAEGKPRPS